MADDKKARALADALLGATEAGVSVPRPTHLDMITAKAVRGYYIAGMTTGRSADIGAYKVSLSTGTWGALPNDAIHYGQAMFPTRSLNDPLLEGEIAFLAQADLTPGCSIEEVLAKCLVAPAIEVADSRWDDWCPSDPERFVIPIAAEIEADNAVAGRLVIGEPWVVPDHDLAELWVQMESGGQVLANAPFQNVMGHPAKAVCWLVDQLAADGRTICKGQIISSGCPHHTPVTTRDLAGACSAIVPGLGAVSVTFD